MRKIIAICAISALTISAFAQENNSETTSNGFKDITNGTEFSLMYSPEIETYGINMSSAINKILYAEWGLLSNLKSAKKGSTYLGYMGVGIHQGFILGNSFMMNFSLAPYIGYSRYSYETTEMRPVISSLPSSYGNYYGIKPFTTTKDENEFTYGATADINFGFKVYKEYGISFGYKIFAGEFKTKNMFKSGFIKVGLCGYF
ncbi:MAG: hypothetical protein IJZ22_00110 [Bacteroidaceae bacterium]|nr:hypothetical protein [Bacteroidaceae bacterium]